MIITKPFFIVLYAQRSMHINYTIITGNKHDLKKISGNLRIYVEFYHVYDSI